jgi:hypothetical protein
VKRQDGVLEVAGGREILLYKGEGVLNGVPRAVTLNYLAGERLSASLQGGEGTLRNKATLRDAEG